MHEGAKVRIAGGAGEWKTGQQPAQGSPGRGGHQCGAHQEQVVSLRSTVVDGAKAPRFPGRAILSPKFLLLSSSIHIFTNFAEKATFFCLFL